MQSSFFRISVFFLALFSVTSVSGQDKVRLRKSVAALRTAADDTSKVLLLNSVGWDTSYDNLALGLKYCEQALQLAEKLNYDHGRMYALNSLGTIYEDMGDYSKALDAHTRGLTLAEKDNDLVEQGTIHMNISQVFESMGDNLKELEHLRKAVDIYTGLKDKEGTCVTNNSLGNSYLRLDSIDKAKNCFKISLDLAIETRLSIAQAHAYGGLAKCFQLEGDTEKSDIVMRRELDILDSLNNDYEYSQAEFSYAVLLMSRGDYARSEKLFFDALDKFGKIGMLDEEKDAWQMLSKNYERSNQPVKALAAWKKYTALKDSMVSENVLRHQHDLEAIYQNEKNEDEIKHLHEVGAEKDKVEAKQHQIVVVLIVGCVLLLLFLFVLYNRSQLRKKTNVQLEKQNAIIEEKNKDITDSINYARRIQEAILPTKELKYRIFPNAFVLFQPRDIVSGDFYWFTEKNGKRLIAAVDCTGHGVPGAFMSMIGNAFLNEIVNEKGITQPSEILNQLRQNVVNALKQSDAESENKDGMDIALCSFDENFSRVEFAGAFNPMWMIRNGELKIFQADKEPVGFQSATSTPFTNHSIELQKGDTIYIFSDGFADQFGGPKGKKFKYSLFQKTLLDIQHKPMAEQEKFLINTFSDWKGDLEQVDDVIVIGIRV